MDVAVRVAVAVIDHEAVNVVHAVAHHRAEIADVAEVVVVVVQLVAAAVAADLARPTLVHLSLDDRSAVPVRNPLHPATANAMALVLEVLVVVAAVRAHPATTRGMIPNENQ